MRREVAAERIELGLELCVEHVADHRHARRPLRHPAEIGVAELSHPPAPAAESGQHDLHRRRRHRMLLRHAVDQISLSFCHVRIPYLKFHEMLRISASPAPAWTVSPTRLPN